MTDWFIEHYLHPGETIRRIRGQDGHEINARNYRVHVDGVENRAVLFKLLPRYDKKTIRKLTLYRQAHARGVAVARVLPTKDGAHYFECDGSLGICFEFHTGTHDASTLPERLEVARELARFNVFLRDKQPPIPRDSRYKNLRDQEFEQVSERSRRDQALGQMLGKRLPSLHGLGTELHDRLASETVPLSIQHTDLHANNLIFRGGKVTAILDFDSLASVLPCLSVAFSCDRFSNTVDDSIAFLKAYQGVDSSFGLEQALQVPDLVRYEALARINFILRLHYFEDDDTWDFELTRHLNILERVERIEGPLRRRLIDEWDR